MAGDSKKTRNKSTITEKLVTYFLFLNITAVLIVGLLSHINSKQAINQRTFEQLNSVKFAKKRQVESFFRDRMNEVRFISGMDHTIHAVNMLKDGKLGSGGPGAINRDNTLNKVFLNFPYYKNIVIKSANGREFVIRPENKPGNIKEGYKIPGKLPDIIKVNGPDTRIFEVSDTSTSDNNSLYLAANIIDYTGDTAGMIVFGLDRDIINSFMLETNPREGLGKSGESYIIGSDMMMRTKSRFYRDTMYSLPV
ncbi:MAG TPA: cache domain-containing protein, partial [Ignavibacteriales bacterium]|nr:cache domain-containing protein [Ignavibacteriales bacterium]